MRCFSAYRCLVRYWFDASAQSIRNFANVSRAFYARVYASRIATILRIFLEFSCNNEKYFTALFLVGRREKHCRWSANYFRNSFLGRVWHVRLKEMLRIEAVDGEIEWFFFCDDIQHTNFVCFHPWCRFAVEWEWSTGRSKTRIGFPDSFFTRTYTRK